MYRFQNVGTTFFLHSLMSITSVFRSNKGKIKMAFAPFCIFSYFFFPVRCLFRWKTFQFQSIFALLGGRLTSFYTMSPPFSSGSIQHPPSLTWLTNRERNTLGIHKQQLFTDPAQHLHLPEVRRRLQIG